MCIPVRRAKRWGGDRAQTRLMAQEKGDGPVRYRGLLDALLKIPREEGLLALWKGLVPRLMRIPPGQARPPLPLPPHQQGGGSSHQQPATGVWARAAHVNVQLAVYAPQKCLTCRSPASHVLILNADRLERHRGRELLTAPRPAT